MISTSKNKHEICPKDLNGEYIDLFTEDYQRKLQLELDPIWQKNNLEYDLRSTAWILEKVRQNKVYAQHLYAALCNNEFVKNEVWALLSETTWSCSWRCAGGIISDMMESGDYLDWYCSGITDGTTEYVSEGVVTLEVRQDLLKLGWVVIEEN